MTNDEQAIRDLVTKWMSATKAGDVDTVLGLMSDDVVFIVPGREPFGKEEFTAGSRAMQGVQFDGTSEIQEIKLLGDWAWMRNRLRVVMAPPGGQAMVRAGYTLTILQKTRDGSWVICRDANLLAPEARS